MYIYIHIYMYIYNGILLSHLLLSAAEVRGAAERRYSASEVRGGNERNHPCLRSGAATRGVTLRPKSGAAAGRRYPTPQARGQGRWPGDQPHVQEAVAARAQEGLEELSHVESQEGRQ